MDNVKLEILVMVLALLFSCTNETEKKIKIENGRYCQNEKYLLSTNDSIPIIRFDFEMPFDTIKKSIDLAYKNKDIDCKEIDYRIPLYVDTSEIISLQLKLRFHSNYCQSLLRYNYYLFLMINSNNEIYIENKKITLKDISKELNNQFKNEYFESNLEKFELLIYWDKKNYNGFMDTVFLKIIDWYLDQARRVSSKKFNKPICNLQNSEIIWLKKVCPLNIMIENPLLISPKHKGNNDSIENSYIGKTNSNDSLFIFRTLNTCSVRDYDFCNQQNGILRHYRKIDNKWYLAWINFSDNGTWIWSQKPYNEGNEGYFELNWLGVGKDSVDIIIPFETGKTWQTLSVRKGKVFGDVVTYYRNGVIREITNLQKGIFKEYYPDGKLRIDMKAEYVLERQMRNGICKFYNNKGILTEKIEAQSFYYDKYGDNFRICNGSVFIFDESGVQIKKLSIDTVGTTIERHYD